jgi:molecular chaperone GrpE
MQDDDNLKNENTIPEVQPLEIPAVDTPVAEDEDIVEFEYNADGEEDIKATLKKLRKNLKEAQKEKIEYLTALQRERADFQNYKKDEITRIARINDLTRERFAEDILPVLDSYDMAFANREAWEKVDKNWRIGVEYIHQQLLKVLAENGIDEILTNEGDQFDHNIHQSVESIETSEESKDNTIAKVLQKGYKNKERILRPARVNVFASKS